MIWSPLTHISSSLISILLLNFTAHIIWTIYLLSSDKDMVGMFVIEDLVCMPVCVRETESPVAYPGFEGGAKPIARAIFSHAP